MIFARRHKRSAGDPDIEAAHFVTDASGVARDTEAETDRRAFIGRGRTIADPAAFDRGATLGGNDGFVLDPVMSLRRRVRVPANKKVRLTFWTVVGANRGRDRRGRGLARPSRQLCAPGDAVVDALAGADPPYGPEPGRCRQCPAACALSDLSGYRICAPRPRASPPGLGKQSALWPMAISGDFPIFAVRIGDVADLEIVAQALRYQEYMRARGLLADLVIVNEQAASYVQDLQQAIESLCENSRLRGYRARTAPAYLRRAPRPDGRGVLPHAAGGGAHRAAHPQRHRVRPGRARGGR